MKFTKAKKPTDLRLLFNPRNIAVIGASYDETKIGHTILKNIIRGGFSGGIYPINPQAGEILGKRVYEKVSSVISSIDLAIIAIPAQFVLIVLKDCAIKKIPFVIIISSGFSEVGNKEEELKIKEFAEDNGIRILGPNVFGIYSSQSSLNATFSGSFIKRGSVAMVTQSGALGLSIMAKSLTEKFGISSMMSLGNKSDIDESDILEYLAKDKKTKFIFYYLEGVKSGERFVRLLSKITPHKPIVVIKAGRSEKGAEAVMSHTGSLAGKDILFDKLVRQAGAYRVNDVDAAFSLLNFLVDVPLKVASGDLLIITNGGGLGVLGADEGEKYKLNFLTNDTHLEKTYRKLLPSFGSFKNPIDLTGQATAEDYERILEKAVNDSKVNSILCLCCQTAQIDATALKKSLVRIYALAHKKMKIFSVCFVGSQLSFNELNRGGFPLYSSVSFAVRDLAYLKNQEKHLPVRGSLGAKIPLLPISKIINRRVTEKRSFLVSEDLQEILSLLKINQPKTSFVEEVSDLPEGAKKISYPVVLKIVSPEITHKTEVGGVILDIQNEEELMSLAEQMFRNLKTKDKKAVVTGFEVSEMIKGGLEVLVGAKNDDTYGTVISCGVGGKYVEVFKDITYRYFDGRRKTIAEMLKDLIIYPIFQGVRGESPLDVDGLVEAIYKIGSLAYKNKNIKEIEINPLVIKKDKVIALDFRVIL